MGIARHRFTDSMVMLEGYACKRLGNYSGCAKAGGLPWCGPLCGGAIWSRFAIKISNMMRVISAFGNHFDVVWNPPTAR
jgi:hypothetical protein